MSQQSGPPYITPVALLGGTPTIPVDVPTTSVFLFLFLLGAVANMTIFQLNNRRSHKFLMSGLLFGFSMARITTMIMRIVWATRPENVSVAIAAQVFVAAGVVLLFVINAIFAQRVVRSVHRRSGWHPFFHWAFVGLYTLLVVSLVMLIAVTVLTFYTLDAHTRLVARDIQWYGQCYFVFVAFLPIPLVVLGLLVPRSEAKVEKFGAGRFRTKVSILLLSSALLTLGAGFRLGVSTSPPRPKEDPAWYHSKACFYVFNFTIEIVVVYLYVILRVDRRFHVPNGSKGPGDYSRSAVGAEKEGLEESPEVYPVTRETRIMSEEEVFDDVPEEELLDGKGLDGRAADTGENHV